jgi:hypothetical protein
MSKDDRDEYTQDDIYRLHALLKKKFNADFSPDGPFWKQVEESYLAFKEKENAWYRERFGDAADMFIKEPRLNKDWIQGGTYLWHVINKEFKGPIPKLTINTPFTPEI